MAPFFIFALVAFLAISFVALAAYLAVRSRWIRLSFGSPLLHAELEAEKSAPPNNQAQQTDSLGQGKGRTR